MSNDPGSAPHQGKPIEPRPPAIANLATWWLVAAGVVAGIGWAVTDHMLRASVTLACACFLGAGMRALLPDDLAGGLVARRRWLDVVTLVVLGLAVGIAGGVLDLRARV